jgi:hypothetical protein
MCFPLLGQNNKMREEKVAMEKDGIEWRMFDGGGRERCNGDRRRTKKGQSIVVTESSVLCKMTMLSFGCC